MYGNRKISVYRGMYTCGIPAYTIEDNKIYEGMYTCGIPAFTIDGNQIYEGMYTSGIPAFTFEWAGKAQVWLDIQLNCYGLI